MKRNCGECPFLKDCEGTPLFVPGRRRTWNVVCLGGSLGGGNPVGGKNPNELLKWDREISSGRPPRNGISPIDIRPDTGERIYPRY